MNNSSGDRKPFVNRCSRSLWLLPLLVPVSAGAQPAPRRQGAPAANAAPSAAAPAGKLALPAPGAPAAAAPVAKPELAPFNVLIIAFDEDALLKPLAPVVPPAEPVPDAAGGGVGAAPGGITPGAIAPAAAPQAPAPPAIVPGRTVPVAPGERKTGPILPDPATPAPNVRGAITPAAWPTFGPAGVQWRALADKKPDKNADLFRLEPDLGGAKPRTPTNTQPTAAPDVAGGFVDNHFLTPAQAPGRAQLASLPLRRALLSLGFADVMTTTTDGTAVSRALGDRRLSNRVLEALRVSIGRLGGGKSTPEDQKAGLLAAARLGQAIGYRTVVVLAVGNSAPAANGGAGRTGAYSILLADAQRETGEAMLFDETGADDNALREAGGSTGAALIEKSVRTWPSSIGTADRSQLAQKHLVAAQAGIAAGAADVAQDELNQSIALDPTRGDTYILLGDVLTAADPAGASVAYRRAVELNARDGATWAKIATAATTTTPPDWPRAMDAGRKALATGFDSVSLRVAMATAQFGRAEIFRKADRLERAEDAEFDARQHLDRALELGPDDPNVVRLLSRQLVAQRQYEVAVQTLDRVAPRYPHDLEIQSLYAQALSRTDGREEDAFVTSSKVWKLGGQRSVDVDIVAYRKLAEGFDLRLFNLGKSAAQLTTGVANAALPREAALLQLTRLKEDMDNANDAINVMRAPAGITADVAGARTFAADIMNQALEKHQVYLETGQEIFRVRALELYRQAVAQLNLARNSK